MKRSQNDLEAVRRDIAETGAMRVYRSLLEICDDRTAVAQARVGAGTAIMRMSGLFDDAKRRSVDDPEPSEMSAEDLQRVMPKLKKELARLEEEIAERAVLIASLDADDEDNVDIFA